MCWYSGSAKELSGAGERDIYRQTGRQTDTHIPIDAHTLTHTLPPSLSHTHGEREGRERKEQLHSDLLPLAGVNKAAAAYSVW